ncbi:hypothetical protein IGI04_008227 [Brassica rapa subsp. trilocularis]|uniref:Uncharacterized protein n=1 Tax=Brassica rapa subsp. trilocularis TaxID=1813537 RepID=A0ABQ7NM04_BRACM|nr:hypothetical protein IGI04_008227 [Brassica rapa subsp. trilocularis]
MTLPNRTDTIMAQAITAAVDGVLAKSQHELRWLLRDFCDTAARVFIQQQQQLTTQLFEEDGEDDVSKSLGANRNHDQIQVHALEDPHDQVGDFDGTPIYDVYDDELSTTLVYDFCGEPHHKSDVTTKEGDTSSQITEKPTFTSNLGRYNVPIKDFAEEPLFDVYDDEIQGFNHDFEVQVLVDDAYLGVSKQHINSGSGDKDFHRQSHHEPPDRGRDKGHAYVDLVAIHKGLTNGSQFTKVLNERRRHLKFMHDQEDCFSELSLIGKHALKNKITYLQESLVLEKEKNKNLEHELHETHKKIRMLNKGSASLDKILSMGRTEKSTMGLGYQGRSSGTQTVFVRGKSIEQNRTKIDLDDAFCCDAMSGLLERLVSKKSRGTENGLHGGINTSQPTNTKDIHIATTEHLGVMSMVAHLRLCERPWKYCSGTFYDSLGNIYVAFVRTHNPLSPREETMDPVVRNKENINLSSPVCLYMLVLFQTVAKLSGEVSFLDVMIVIYPMSFTWLVYFAKGSLQKFILGVDVSYCCHRHVCALMRLSDLFVGKRKENIQLEWMFLMGSVVFYVGNLVTVGDDEHVKVQLLTCLVSFTKFLCVRFGSRWKHVGLNGRPEAFDVIQYVWVFGAYKTVTFIELPCSPALWSLCIHVNFVSMYDILRSSAVWPLSHIGVKVSSKVFPSLGLQTELRWGVSKRKVKFVHSPQAGLGCIFMLIICWSDIACESSNSAFQHAFKAATCLLTFSVLLSSSTKFSMVVRAITRSVGRELICGVIRNVFKSTQRQLPKKNAREILFANVRGCIYLFELRSTVSILTCPPSQVSPVSCFMVYDVFQIAESTFTSPLWVHNQILSLPPTFHIVPWTSFSTTIFHLGFYCVIYKARCGALSYSDVMVLWHKDDNFSLIFSASSSDERCHPRVSHAITRPFSLVQTSEASQLPALLRSNRSTYLPFFYCRGNESAGGPCVVLTFD